MRLSLLLGPRGLPRRRADVRAVDHDRLSDLARGMVRRGVVVLVARRLIMYCRGRRDTAHRVGRASRATANGAELMGGLLLVDLRDRLWFEAARIFMAWGGFLRRDLLEVGVYKRPVGPDPHGVYQE